MERLRATLADADLIKSILLCVCFIGLNILDAWLTRVALGLGSYELNSFMNMRFGSSMLLKGLIAAEIVLVLILFRRGRLLRPLNLCMILICTWNSFAILSWS
jgi:hypothetical protein